MIPTPRFSQGMPGPVEPTPCIVYPAPRRAVPNRDAFKGLGFGVLGFRVKGFRV